MKQICKISLESIAALCASTLLFSLIFSVLYYFNLISTALFHNANWISGIICFGFGGILLGLLAQKKALLHAFIIAALLFGVAMLLTNDYTLMACLKTLSKAAAYLLFCMFTYAKTKKA